MRIAPKAVSLAALLAAGCSGTVPHLRGVPDSGMAAVIVGGRFIAPSGETQSGRLSVNLEGSSEEYRLPVLPRRSLLYQIEPGRYRLSSQRNFLGLRRSSFKVAIEGKTYRVPFPSDFTRRALFDVRSKKIIPIGIVEVKLEPTLPPQKPVVNVRLDDSVDARRWLIQAIIHEMMNPHVSPEDRESAIAWTHALQASLMEVMTQTEWKPPPEKSGP